MTCTDLFHYSWNSPPPCDVTKGTNISLPTLFYRTLQITDELVRAAKSSHRCWSFHGLVDDIIEAFIQNNLNSCWRNTADSRVMDGCRRPWLRRERLVNRPRCSFFFFFDSHLIIFPEEMWETIIDTLKTWRKRFDPFPQLNAALQIRVCEPLFGWSVPPPFEL